MAAFLAAGIGVFAVGLFVLLNEAGIFAAPALYGPAGGVSGRTTFALIVWLVAWGMLHARWKTREVAAGTVYPRDLSAGLGARIVRNSASAAARTSHRVRTPEVERDEDGGARR